MKDRSELFNQLYEKLRQLAKGRLAGEHRANASGDATSLVHEAYLKLRTWSNGFQNERHFLATASAAMRQILVDRARARKSQKRGAEVEPLSVSMDGPVEGAQSVVDLLLFDETLERLASFDARAAQIVEMRVFLGLSEEEIASDLGISSRTVKRDWSAASAWLKAEMGSKERCLRPAANGVGDSAPKGESHRLP
jgi:RNA polymerase sigma factor (TIGR02999 family)